MRVIRILPLVALVLCTLPRFSYSADPQPAPEWEKILDGVYSFTWRGRSDLNDEITKQEARTRQSLSEYIAAWDRRMAAPAVSVGNEAGGGGCGPLRYCASDFKDINAFISRLREKKDPIARAIFEKLSPPARKAVLGPWPAPEGRTAAVVAILADDLSRIVNEDTFYATGSLEDITLSPATAALVQDPNSAMNRACINKTIIAEAFSAELSRDFKCVLQKDETYRRVAAAKTVQYLRTGERKTLEEAVALTDTFANKLMYTDFAFWYYYPRVLLDIEVGDPAAFQSDAYKILNEVVLWEEPLEAGKTSPAELERRHYAWNLADAVLTRGILERKIGGLEALGPAVWVLGSRNTSFAISQKERDLLRFIVDVRNYLSGSESDNYRLNYAVAMSEGKRRRALLARALEAKQKGELVEKMFNDSLEYMKLASDWAGTWQGKSASVAGCLELVNTGLARMREILSQETLDSLGSVQDTGCYGMAAALYRGMAEREESGWEKLRFNDRKVFVDSAQALWNAMRRNALYVADYHLDRMSRDDFQSVMDNSIPAEKSLLRYVNLFQTYASKDGPREIMPDSAYFAYAEALKKLSRLEREVYSFNRNMQLHNQSVDFLLKAIAVYPYDDSLSEYATLSRNMNTGATKTYPDVVVRSVVSNPVVAKCLQGNKSYCDPHTRQALEWNIYKVRNKLYSSTNANVLDDMKQLVGEWRSGASSKGKAKGDIQRSPVVAVAERYIALSGELSPLFDSAESLLKKCNSEVSDCTGLDVITDRMLSRRNQLEKVKDELVAACNNWLRQYGSATDTAGGSKDQESVRSLAGMAVDEYVNQIDRIIGVAVQKKLIEMSLMDNNPMHKIIKSGYYAQK